MGTVEGHPDFGILEARLLKLVEEAKTDGPLGPLTPVLIIVPTARLRSHLQRLLAGRFQALLNVTILHHNALASQAAEAAGTSLPGDLSRKVLEAMLLDCLRKVKGRLDDYVRSCPGAVSSLLSTLDDLRSAGVEPAEGLEALERGSDGREILRLLADYGKALDRIELSGLADISGRMRAALPHVASFAGRFHRVIHYGAYELTGSSLEVMQGVESGGGPIHWLVPSHPSSPAYAFARRFAAESLGTEAQEIPEPAGGAERLLGSRLTCLYDDGAEPPEPLPEKAPLFFFHAQGMAAELREVAQRILELAAGSVPLSRIAVVSRTLEPYTPHLRRILFDEFRIPFTTRASAGAISDPHVQAVLNLLALEPGNFERQPLLDLARSGSFAWREFSLEEHVHGWDELSRRHRIIRGREAWTRDLDRRAGRELERAKRSGGGEPDPARIGRAKDRKRDAETLGQLVSTLYGELSALRRAESWEAWRAALRVLLEERIEGFRPAEGAAPPAGICAVQDALSHLAGFPAADIPFTPESAATAFRAILEEVRIPLGSVGGREDLFDNGGVPVLDAMQARGLSFDAVFLIGFNADLFPRRPREDPFLGDTVRERLRSELRRPVPVKSAGRDEEHLLLAHILGSARRELTVSWQRADESGKAKIPSLALRELARIAFGTADPARILDPGVALRVAAHPVDAVTDARDRFGLIPSDSARLGAALQLGSPGRVRAAVEQLHSGGMAAENLLPGLDLLDAVERFDSNDLRFDAVIGRGAPPLPPWSPTSLESFGSCPQQFFFRYLLRVNEMDPVLPEHEFDLRELGDLAHRVLQDIYAALLEEKRLSAPDADPEAAARRGVELMEEIWPDRAASLASRVHRRFRLIWSGFSALWKNAIQTFLLHDITELEKSHSRVLDLERSVEASIEILKIGEPLVLRGRIDRIVRDGADTVIVGDYKSAGKLDKRVDGARILKGISLQMPLYLLMAEEESRSRGVQGGRVGAEVIGVGPAYSEGSPPAEPNPDGYPARESLEPARFQKLRSGLKQTLHFLVETARHGVFPLNAGSDRCGHCAYARACRKNHAPTRARLELSPQVAPYRALDGKHTRNMTVDLELPWEDPA